jgi:hypothetical protein
VCQQGSQLKGLIEKAMVPRQLVPAPKEVYESIDMSSALVWGIFTVHLDSNGLNSGVSTEKKG